VCRIETSGPKLLYCFGAADLHLVPAQRAVREQFERVDNVRDLTHGRTGVRAPARQERFCPKCGAPQSFLPQLGNIAIYAGTITS
jgi:hypothetical protein